MKNKRVIILCAVLGILLLAGVLGTGAVLAISSNSTPSIVQRLAEKLNLKESDVQKAFDEVREEKRQEAQTRFEEQLNQAVKDGKITKAQKDVILKKQVQIQDKLEEVYKLKQELGTWAEENNIDLREIGDYGLGHHGPGKFWGGHGPKVW